MTMTDAVDFLLLLDGAGLLAIFWFTALFEIPRYTLSLVAIVVAEWWGRRDLSGDRPAAQTVSVVLAGHNEASAISACVASLREQTWKDIEIIAVDDGSVDGMADVLHDLRRRGLIDQALASNVRCGKSAAVNLGVTFATGEIVIICDVDCSFDRDAIVRLIAPFNDPRVGAVSGNIGVRNATSSPVAALQTIEYMVGISAGKRALDSLNLVTCVSGAFGAFRKTALQHVGGYDVGPGEDLDLTLKLRRAGWKICFAPDAWCLTEVPDTLLGFLRQRRRWERDALRLRLRKHRNLFSFGKRGFQVTEIIQQAENLLFVVLPTIMFPFYLAFLFWWYSKFAVVIQVAILVGYAFLDVMLFISSAIISRRHVNIPWLLLHVPISGFFSAYLMRFARLVAYAEEWIFRTSYQDNYVPARVLRRAPIW